MKLPLRVGAFVVFLFCVAGGPVVAELPSSSTSAAPAPAPAPAPADTTAGAPPMTPPAAAAPAPVDPAKEAEIRKLLQEIGTLKVVNQMLTQIMGALHERASQLPPEFWDQLQTEMDPSKLVDKLIPIYDKYYTLDDLKAVNAFYLTPAGQHMLQVQPEILKESIAIGQQWSRQAAMKTMLELEKYKEQQASSTPPAATTNATPSATPSPAPPAPASP